MARRDGAAGKGAVGGASALVVLTVSFAFLTILARFLNSGFTVLQQVYLRTAVACCLAVIVFGRRIRWRALMRLPAREWTVVSARAVLLYPVGAALFSKAATLTLVGDVSFIAALPFVSVLGFALRREPATRRAVAYVCGSAAGVAAVSLHSAGGVGATAASGRGDLLALASMLAIAAGYLGRSWHGGRLNNQELTVLMLAVGTGCTALASAALGEGAPHLDLPWTLWAAVPAAGTLNVANTFLINYGFEHVGAVRAGNLLTLESVWGLGLGLLVYGQWPSAPELAGGAAIVGCAVGLNSARGKPTDAAVTTADTRTQADTKTETETNPQAHPEQQSAAARKRARRRTH